MSTPHFDIIYNAKQQELGLRYAQQAEKAYALLSPVFTVLPEKTLIIINDKTDATNGYATRIPYAHIMTYPVLPGPQESLGESGDWSLELLAHEYTHILTFEPAEGVFKYLRGVFGSIASPNLLLPTWWKEGLAVEVESMITPHGGRLKSLYQDASIRAWVEAKKLNNYGIDTANEYIPEWPEGARAYVFGSLFWSQSVEDYGTKVMNNLNLRHSSRVPYFISEPAEDLLHNTYDTAYEKALYVTTQKAQAQLQQLKAVPPTELKPLPIEAKYSSAPAISDDGKYLALVNVDYKSDRVMDIFIRDPETRTITKRLEVEIKKQEEPLVPSKDGPPSGTIQKIAWFHKSPKIIYDQLRYVNRIERYSDLHIYDVAERKNKRLTTALRAREPSVAPADDKVVFVRLDGGRTHLGLYDLASEKTEILYSPAMEERISSPVFTDADHIVFAIRHHDGLENLMQYTLSSKSVAAILPSFLQARFPTASKLGLMFTSSNNGVHNLYLASPDLKTAKPLTHVLTMVSSAAYDPDTESIYATTMTDAGPAVLRIEKDQWQKTPATLPKIDSLFGDRYKDLLQPAANTPTVSPDKFEISDYSPYSYLWPRYWIPYLWTSDDGGLVVQAQTSGFDPLQKHAYSVVGSWNTYLNAADGDVSYLNNVTSLPVQFDASSVHSYIVVKENLTHDNLASLSVLPDIWGLSEKMSLQLGWRYLERTAVNVPASKRSGPFGTLVYKNFTAGGEQFTPQTGGGAYLSAVNYVAGDGLLNHSQFQTGGVYYFSKFLPKLHALMIRLSVFYTPEHISYTYGTQSLALDYYGADLGAKFLARGYSTGQFIGRSMYNTNIEYRFPVKDIYRGSGTAPFFLRRLTGAVIADGISTDGYAYNVVNNATTSTADAVKATDIFWSYGLEAHLETTVGYMLPMSFVVGLYQGGNSKYAPNPKAGLAVQFSGF